MKFIVNPNLKILPTQVLLLVYLFLEIKNNDFFEKMLKNKAKINNEYYIDESLKSSIILNYKLYNYQIDKFISTGTPDELKLNSEKYK